MAKKRDLAAKLDDLRRQVVQEGANTVARIAQVQSNLTDAINELKVAVTEQAERLDASMVAVIDLISEHESKTERTLRDHEERLKRLEDRPPAA